MAVANESFYEQINQLTEVLKGFRKSFKLFNKEKEILELEKERYKLIYSEIHKVLAPRKKDECEKKIRNIIRDVILYDIGICEAKVKRFNTALNELQSAKNKKDVANGQKIELCYKYLNEWLILFENYWAIASFRSLEHFVQFMEWDFDDKKKLWKYSLDPYNDNKYSGLSYGFFFYMNKAILTREIRFIEKQQPTGTGKTYADTDCMLFIIGVNRENDILKVFGNPANLDDCGTYLKEGFMNPRFAQVFPEFQKFHEMDGELESNIFAVCKLSKEITIKIADSKKINIRIISKDKKVSGIRARFIFIDDITQQEDAGKDRMHEKDWSTFWNVWFERKYSDEDVVIVASGTTYHYNDILSRLKRYYSKGKIIRSTINKFTYLNEDKDCVFVVVPRIDYEMNRVTLPQKFSMEEALAKKKRDEKMFMAMDQQEPLPPDGTPFYIDSILIYDEIPEERSEFCWSALDASRMGYDFTSMPVFVQSGEFHYLKDALYVQQPMDLVYQQIIDKIKQHKITKLVIEKNTDTSLKYLLDKMLVEQGIYYCEIIEIYSTIKKEERIFNMENCIKTRCKFPSDKLYAYSSMLGKFMNDFMFFSYVDKNEHDDSVDSIAMFCQTFLMQDNVKTKAKLLYI